MGKVGDKVTIFLYGKEIAISGEAPYLPTPSHIRTGLKEANLKLIDISTPKFPNTFTMVDDDDFERMSCFKWSAFQSKNRRVIYAIRNDLVDGRQRSILMHREILGGKASQITDHADGNGLNNQKTNIRPANRSQNGFNCRRANNPNKASKYRGVTRDKKTKTESWRANIKIGGKQTYLGSFKTQEQASQAYMEAARSAYREFVPKELVDNESEVLA